MTCPWCRVFIVCVVAITDVAVYIYEQYKGDTGAALTSNTAEGDVNTPTAVVSAAPISYAAHISGALAGLLVGIVCLKNLRWEKYERYIWAVAVCVFVLLIGTAIVFSLAMPNYFMDTGGIPGFPSHTLGMNCSAEPFVL